MKPTGPSGDATVLALVKVTGGHLELQGSEDHMGFRNVCEVKHRLGGYVG